MHDLSSLLILEGLNSETRVTHRRCPTVRIRWTRSQPPDRKSQEALQNLHRGETHSEDNTRRSRRRRSPGVLETRKDCGNYRNAPLNWL